MLAQPYGSWQMLRYNFHTELNLFLTETKLIIRKDFLTSALNVAALVDRSVLLFMLSFLCDVGVCCYLEMQLMYMWHMLSLQCKKHKPLQCATQRKTAFLLADYVSAASPTPPHFLLSDVFNCEQYLRAWLTSYIQSANDTNDTKTMLFLNRNALSNNR